LKRELSFILLFALLLRLITFSGPVYGQTVSNASGDLTGVNLGELIHLVWAVEPGTDEYFIYRSYFGGTWVLLYTWPGDLLPSTRGQVDVTPDAASNILCYRVDAKNKLRVVIRTYKPICVPVYVL